MTRASAGTEHCGCWPWCHCCGPGSILATCGATFPTLSGLCLPHPVQGHCPRSTYPTLMGILGGECHLRKQQTRPTHPPGGGPTGAEAPSSQGGRSTQVATSVRWAGRGPLHNCPSLWVCRGTDDGLKPCLHLLRVETMKHAGQQDLQDRRQLGCSRKAWAWRASSQAGQEGSRFPSPRGDRHAGGKGQPLAPGAATRGPHGLHGCQVASAPREESSSCQGSRAPTPHRP